MNTAALQSALDQVTTQIGALRPDAVLILGSGWCRVAEAFDEVSTLPYDAISCMGMPGVEGHSGRLIHATRSNRHYLIFAGRRHWYEGAGWDPIAFPVFLAKQYHAGALVLTNAAGGIRQDLATGALMLVDDHINAMGVNPLLGRHDSMWGPRFPDQTHVYDPTLRAAMDRAATDAAVSLSHGVYLATSGPTYETPAEVAAFRAMGADAVGMSTVPEAILANGAGLRTVALSCITNMASGLADGTMSHEDVLAVSQQAVPKMQRLLIGFLDLLKLEQMQQHHG
jgi:inosine/guanosine/xanthosine phosphorylase family protein